MIKSAWFPFSEEVFGTNHHDTHPASLRSINVVLGVNTTRYRCSPIVVQVVVQLAISCSKFEGFQEQRVVQESKCIEDIEIELQDLLAWPQVRVISTVYLFGED